MSGLDGLIAIIDGIVKAILAIFNGIGSAAIMLATPIPTPLPMPRLTITPVPSNVVSGLNNPCCWTAVAIALGSLLVMILNWIITMRQD